MQVVVLAAGKGTRMRSDRPKVLQEMLGQTMLEHVLRTLVRLGIRDPKLIIGSGASQVRSFIDQVQKRLTVRPSFVLQREQKGTGHAVMMAKAALGSRGEDVLIWPGDMPLLQASTLRALIQYHRQSGVEVSALSALQIDPKGYGRILRAGGRFYAIREELDATEEERRIQEVNTGVYLFKKKSLFEALGKIRPNNRKRELYLTDTIEVLSKRGAEMEAFPLAVGAEALGINSRGELACAVAVMNKREIQHHQERGVAIVAPDQTFIESGVRIGKDTVIYPWCYIESGVKIGSGCQIGPFAKIRSGSLIEDEAIVGSFVEVARTRVGKKVMAKHLAYLGDAVIGAGSNIGAGTIFANFDGKRKHRSRLGKNVQVGSNTVFVSPVTVADYARTGAGSVVTAGTQVKKKQVVAGVPARAIKKNKRK